VATPSFHSVSPLRSLVEVTRLVRSVERLPELLEAIARTIAETLGYRTVVINVYRPAWNDFVVESVYGDNRTRDALLGNRRSVGEWDELLCERYFHRGAYVVPAGEVPHDAGAGHPEDALFLPMRHTDGHLLGVLSVDRPASGLRAADEQLDVLVSLADHAAIAVQSAQERAEAVRHRVALEQLLAVSSELISEAGPDAILDAVCEAVRDALGFQNVLASLVDPVSGLLEPCAAVGWAVGQPDAVPVLFRDVKPLLDPAFEIEGCFLLPAKEAELRLDREAARGLYVSELNGSGPWAWSFHWLLVPLYAENGDVIGILWADEPDDRLLPSPGRLQALRVFANQATAAVLASQYVDELRFLADHDPLTRLLNRRAFVERLDGEVARAVRYDRPFGLVLCDLDGFKELNDRDGHPAGDAALQRFGLVLQAALRKGDDAYRIGGDEFAVLLAEATEADARAVVGRVTEHLGDGLRASFGVASCPEHAGDAQTLFRLADDALYQAKRDGSGLRFVLA
jgi:diguanylate cyclase (GGDEF)-like protein